MLRYVGQDGSVAAESERFSWPPAHSLDQGSADSNNARASATGSGGSAPPKSAAASAPAGVRGLTILSTSGAPGEDAAVLRVRFELGGCHVSAAGDYIALENEFGTATYEYVAEGQPAGELSLDCSGVCEGDDGMWAAAYLDAAGNSAMRTAPFRWTDSAQAWAAAAAGGSDVSAEQQATAPPGPRAVRVVSLPDALEAVKQAVGLQRSGLAGLAACDAARELLGLCATPARTRLKESLTEVIQLLGLNIRCATMDEKIPKPAAAGALLPAPPRPQLHGEQTSVCGFCERAPCACAHGGAPTTDGAPAPPGGDASDASDRNDSDAESDAESDADSDAGDARNASGGGGDRVCGCDHEAPAGLPRWRCAVCGGGLRGGSGGGATASLGSKGSPLAQEADPADELKEQLSELAELAADGMLDAAEYAQLKADVIKAHRHHHADAADAQRPQNAASECADTLLGEARPLVQGWLCAGTCRVGMAVQMSSQRGVLERACAEIEWPTYGRTEYLGRTGLVMGVDHSSTANRVAGVEWVGGRNDDVCWVPKACLQQVAMQQLGPIPGGWTRVAARRLEDGGTTAGGWKHDFSGKTRFLRPVHRAEDPGALRREFAARDAANEAKQAEREREQRADAKAKAKARARAKASDRSGGGSCSGHFGSEARVCGSCGFGGKESDCVKCGRHAAYNFTTAVLCSSCALGTKYKDCVKCGKWAPSNFKDARLCSSCGFGTKKRMCVKGGRVAM